VTDAPATSPDHTAAVTDAPATSPDHTAAVTDAPATSPDHTAAVTDAPATSPDHTAAVTDAPATSPDHTAAVTDAPATSSDPTPAVTDAPATSSDPSTCIKYPCLSNPCGVGSTCEARANHTFVCKCLPGDFYNNITLRSKVFPGKLSLRKPFNEKMKDTTSKEFKETADEIVAAVSNQLVLSINKCVFMDIF
uniref:EGF-like domain-containing protein n=1 Tax=Maylandia zebra TaxID=106582 RepID=A0A3P9CAP2_9CICH